jgi:uncharacterized protein
MGLRLLLLLITLWALILILRRAVRRRSQEPANRPQPPVDTVSCAHCGLHIPKQEALVRDNRYFCCEQHLPPENRKN